MYVEVVCTKFKTNTSINPSIQPLSQEKGAFKGVYVAPEI